MIQHKRTGQQPPGSLRVDPQAATVAGESGARGAGAAASTRKGVLAPSTAGKADWTDGIRGATSVEPGAAGAAGAGSGAGAGGGAAAGGSAIAGNALGSTPSQEFHANRDNGLKYTINTKLIDPVVAAAYRPLLLDEESQAFLDSCRPSYLRSVAASVLRMVYSLTDTNAILNRGQMFVLSKAHCVELLGSEKRAKLLDVGAGDGHVTAHLEPLFDDITVTEASKYMGNRLRSRGYRVVEDLDLTHEVATHGPFDVVSFLNVLDRCDKPALLLRQMRDLLKPGGRLLMAVVLPFCEFVETGVGTGQRPPIDPLPMRGARCRDNASFERSLSALVTRVLLPAGFALERVARVPYLCKGDQYKNYYVLDDAIIVLRRIEDTSATAAAGSGSSAAAAASTVTPGTRTAADASGLATETAATGSGAGDNEGS